MRTRTRSSVGVVFAGLIPALLGGPVFSILMLGLGVAGFREYLDLARRATRPVPRAIAGTGYLVIAAFTIAAMSWQGAIALYVAVFLSLSLPLVAALRHESQDAGFVGWSQVTAGALYLGIPVFGAIALRGDESPGAAEWVSDVANGLAFGWRPAPSGLAWTLVAILATWFGDSAALLVGRIFGKTPLAPRLSPNKTVEGAIGGLVCSALVGGSVFYVCGLGNLGIGAIVGAAIGVAGQLGDLAESSMKRHAGVKDSGTAIPGHGGVLDRIDALLFAFPVGFILAAIVDGASL